MAETYLTGCQHYSHYNIIGYCDRPFEGIIPMNATMIKKHNDRVTDDDTVYNFGDFAFYSKNANGNGSIINPKDIIKQLKGYQIFIEGNHDRHGRNKLNTKNEQIIINQHGLRIQLLHDPLYARIDYDLILHSHVHKAWKIKELHYCGQTRLMINVGVDVNNFMPVRLDEVLSIYYKWKKQREKINRWAIPEIITEMNKNYGN